MRTKLTRQFQFHKFGKHLHQQEMDTTSASESCPSPPPQLAPLPLLSKRSSNSSESGENLAEAKLSREMVLQTKLIVAELLQFIMDIRRDFRISTALSFFKVWLC